mgnify:CR=1 FL=1
MPHEDETWEVDFRALPKPAKQKETEYLGLVVDLVTRTPLVLMTLDYTPNVNDLADLLADAMRHPITDSPHRPSRLLLRDNPRWKELFPHLKELGIEVSIQDELPNLEEVFEDFGRQMRRASPQRVSANTSRTQNWAKADKCQYIPNRADQSWKPRLGSR